MDDDPRMRTQTEKHVNPSKYLTLDRFYALNLNTALDIF